QSVSLSLSVSVCQLHLSLCCSVSPHTSTVTQSLTRSPLTFSDLCPLVAGVCVLLSGQTVSAGERENISLNVSPNLQQFFIEDSVSLSCIGGGQTGGQTVGQTGGQTVKRTSGGQTGDCGSGFGTSDGSSCRVSGLSQSDSGVYWCETSSGETSLQVNISVTLKDGPFILEIPALPVMTGSDVTLRCRNKDGSTRAAYFLKNGIHTGDRVKVQELSISRVQESDEGFYSCSTDLFGPSPQSWLRVRVYHNKLMTYPVFTAPPPPPSVSVSRLLCHLVAVCPYCVCTVLMVPFTNFRGRTADGPMSVNSVITMFMISIVT
uniref:Ig-like domain-containing protein n=1 Tax=Seriola lalandi dorsalis TaxID=1841481 RepID=A0A3B4YBS1_SERLL